MYSKKITTQEECEAAQKRIREIQVELLILETEGNPLIDAHIEWQKKEGLR